MALSETELIQRFFSKGALHSQLIRKGIGDDAAIFTIPPDFEVVTTVDVLNEGIHFPENTSAYDIGYKALAVSLSDIAAMGAQPFSVLLTLCLPEAELGWLEQFATGFFSLADAYQVDLIGGDVTCGPLSIATVVNGLVPSQKAMLRSKAKINDLIYVTGTLGDAGYALQLLSEEKQGIDPDLLHRLNRPTPRVNAGLVLRDLATSAMDISDGLLLDLEKLCQASGCGAIIRLENMPLSKHLITTPSREAAQLLALTAGDDYELLFTVAPENKAKVERLHLDVPITLVGEITCAHGVVVKNNDGTIVSPSRHGYDHFQ